MILEARLSRTWIKRMLFMSAFFFGLAIYCVYDGAIAYPKKNAIYREHQKFVSEGRAAEWPDHAKSRGWKVKPPEKLHSETEQFVMAALATLAALCPLGWLAMCWKRTLRSDPDAVYSDTGTRVPFASMREVDKRRWDTKGIAVVAYEEDGRRRKLVLDDYKYAGGEEILARVEEHLAQRAGGS